ncbi:hypothetical protein ES332_D12G113200v1 [Gossypium tomentosum]|uniref:cytokinin riboside 5'-monophosphate phosphoribohydrolase n=1 Tax=Gossypium tomentosum TaxID=34277 RepID=A0A5D2I7Z0_GOSTO|nr:hypothetical protein ES332_D12G113200v1 [Gossypium tomentosum]
MGLMGSVATSTYVKGSSSFGINRKSIQKNALCGPTIDKELPIWSIPERLGLMFETDYTFITFPRGFGTIEEIFCITSWSYFFKHKKKLISLLNVNGYYNNLHSFLDNVVKSGFVFSEVRNVLIFAATVDELFVKLQAFEYHTDLITQQIFESRQKEILTSKKWI